jgi:hypothetical protein
MQVTINSVYSRHRLPAIGKSSIATPICWARIRQAKSPAATISSTRSIIPSSSTEWGM